MAAETAGRRCGSGRFCSANRNARIRGTNAMIEFYSAGDFSHLAPAFTAAPQSGTWQAAGSDWVEW